MKSRPVGVFAVVLSLAILQGACEPGSTRPSTNPVTIMTFNVENLFDNVDDPGKDDETYLPIESKQSAEHRAKCAGIEVDHWREQCLDWDWSDAIVEKKLSVVANAILQINGGRGPDILALQEVENIAILERLRTDFLAQAGYRPAILLEGHDIRGIDVAFLTRLPVVGEPRLHPFPIEGIDPARRGDTRGILEVTFELPDGALLTGFAVHFPAPFHPTGMRETAYDQLNALRRSLPDDRYVFAAGDFNTTSREDREEKMLQRFVRPSWIVVHEQGCVDCKGTQYYARDDSWSFLDMLLWSPAENRGDDATWGIRAGSVAIASKTRQQVTAEATPARFALPEGSGVSDHWPLVFDIELK